MFRISVTGISTDEVIEAYVVNVSHSQSNKWEITRSFEDIVAMSQSVQTVIADIPTVPESHEPKDVEEYLMKLIQLSSADSFLQWKPLWKFLDDRQVTESRVTELICLATQQQVAALKAENAVFSQQLQDLTFKYQQLSELVSSLVSEVPVKREWHPSMDAVVDSSKTPSKVPPMTAPPGFERSNGTECIAAASSAAASSAAAPSFSPFKETAVGGQTWISAVSASSAAGTSCSSSCNAAAAAAQGSSSHTSTTTSSPVIFSARTDSGKDLSSMDMDQETALTSRGGIASFGVVPEAVAEANAASSIAATPVVAAKEFKPRPATAVDRAVEAVLTLLNPYESQTLYRSSVVGVLRKQCRLSLPFCNVYETGLHALNCNLPDDPILLTAIFSKNHSANWCKSLLYRLSMVVEGCNAAGGYMAMKRDDPRFEGDDFKALANHMLSNAHYVEAPTGVQPAVHLKTNYDVVNKVRCVVDALECEIAPNGRSDVCLLSFFEEVAALVGQNDLFKRSVLLIRAWWVYETATYVGSVIKHYLPDNAMLIMVTMLFNLYYDEISHPIDALHKLLVVFSKYDGFSELITIQGIVPYTMQNKQQGINVSVSGNQLTLNPPLESHLIPQSLLDKYYKLYHCSLFPEPMPFARRPDANTASTATAAASSDAEPSEVDAAAVANGTVTVEDRTGTPLRAPLSVSVERHGYNVLHPFSQNNLIPDKMTTRRVVLIHKAFQVGVANLNNLLSGAWKETGDAFVAPTSVVPDIKSFFPACTGRFKDNWRPDALGNSIELISGTKEVTPLTNEATKDRLLYQMQYCNFVLEGQVLDNVIMQITVEALESRGGMAVGEIGKLLTEQSSIPNLSQKLKEGFGGLKKLLEKFKDQFVVGTNHQFNPHVLLRNSLTPEQEMQLSAGIFPVELNKVSKKQQLQQHGGYRTEEGNAMYNGMVSGAAGGGRSNQNYLSYNVNTSQDRRMRQQMNANMAGGGANGGGAQKSTSPRMLQMGGNLSLQPPQMQHPSYAQRREKQQQMHPQQQLQMKVSPSNANHSQTSSLDMDWSEFGGLLNTAPTLNRGHQQIGTSFVSIKSAHVVPTNPRLPVSGATASSLGLGGTAGAAGLSGSPSTSFLAGGSLRSSHSAGTMPTWLLQEEEPEEHYQAAFQQALSLPGSAQKQQQQQSQQSLLGFDLDTDSSANAYASLWGDTSSTSILSGSFNASELNVNASAFSSSQFQMPPGRGGSRN